MSLDYSPQQHPALVSRAPGSSREEELYLILTPAGQAAWTPKPADATSFESMREASRAALRLPAGLRAFSVPAPQRTSLVH